MFHGIRQGQNENARSSLTRFALSVHENAKGLLIIFIETGTAIDDAVIISKRRQRQGTALSQKRNDRYWRLCMTGTPSDSSIVPSLFSSRQLGYRRIRSRRFSRSQSKISLLSPVQVGSQIPRNLSQESSKVSLLSKVVGAKTSTFSVWAVLSSRNRMTLSISNSLSPP
jgi:hypothetical protein